MSINLNNVNISLQQFQDISRGKYNAGEVMLQDETTLGKVNDHVHFKSWNKTDISHAEVLAIKQAFVKALAQGGVGDAEIARVRRDLGLGAGKAVDTRLAERSLKPLSRQQIREILDRNAAAINARTGAETICTSDQLYARVSEDTRNSRAATRGTVNAGLDRSRTVSEHHRISLFQALVAGDVDFRTGDDRKELLRMANAALDLVMRQSNGHPRADVPARIALGDGNVRALSMDTGMDEAAWARKLEDMIVRFHHLAPSALEIGMREQFRAVPREDRTAWLDGMVQTVDRVGLVTRALAVALLQDAGISDHESLSLVNHISDGTAMTLLRSLAALPQDASENDARQCLEEVRGAAGDAVGDGTYIPATTTEEFNEGVALVFTSDTGKIFGSFKMLADELVADLRAVFGEGVVRADAYIDRFLDHPVVFDAIREVGNGVRATPDALRATFRSNVFANAARDAIIRFAEERGAALGVGEFNAMEVGHVLKAAMPDFPGRLAACANADEVAALLGGIRDRVDTEVRRIAAIESGRRAFPVMVREALSAKTGIPASVLVDPAISRARLSTLSDRVATRLSRRELPSGSDEEIRAAFRAEAERFVAERAAILEKVAASPLTSAGKAELSEWLLARDKVDYIDLDAILAEAAKPDLSVLVAALRAGAPKEQVYAAMKPFDDFIGRATSALLAGKPGEIGIQERTTITTLLIIASLDRFPGIRTYLAAFFARPEVAADGDARYYNPDSPASASKSFAPYAQTDAAARTELAAKIAAGAPSPGYAQALARAVRAEGLDLSPDEALSLFVKGTPVGDMLAQILGELNAAVTPDALEALARGAIRTHKNGDIRQMAETLRGDLLDKVDTDHFYSLPERYLDASQKALAKLRRKFGEAAVPQDVHIGDVIPMAAIAAKLRPFVNAARDARRIVTPDEFHQALVAAGEFEIAVRTVRSEADALAEELALPKPPGSLARMFLQGNPAFLRALGRADGPDDVRAALDGVHETLRDAVQQEKQLAELVDAATDIMAGKLANALHITKEEARDFGFVYTLSDRLEQIKDDILAGKHPGCREEGFSAPMEFNLLIENYVNAYVGRFAAIDALQGVSDETKDDLRGVLRQQNRPDKPYVDPVRAQRIAAKLDGAALLAALGAPDATDQARLAAIAKYADDIEAAALEEYADVLQGGKLGSDDLLPILANVHAFVMGATPGLKAALERLSADPFVLRAASAFQQEEHHDHPLRITVLNSLF